MDVLLCCDSSERHEAVVAMSSLATLNEGGLILKNLQAFLESLDLGFPSRLTLLIGLRLGNTTVFDLCIVLEYCRKLCVGVIPLSRELTDAFVQALELLGLDPHP